MSNPRTPEERTQFIDDVAARLFEQFDSVQILVTFDEDGYTKSCFRGCGNFYARQGMAREFIQIDQARNQAKEIALELNGGNDD